MGTLAPTSAKPAHTPQWEWVYIPVERLDFIITAHDTACPREGEIYHITSSFPEAIKLYYRSVNNELLDVTYIPNVDPPMSSFAAWRLEGYARVNEYVLRVADLERMTLEGLRAKFVLCAQVDVKEDVSMLVHDDKRGFSYTCKMASVSEYVDYFTKGLLNLRHIHRDLKLPV
jgi:hypothetical protein